MANWCSNTVHFECSNNTLKRLRKFFNAMAVKEKKEEQGQLPHFVHVEKGWLFDIRFEDEALYYETKWCPNVEVIKAIADHFKAGFTYSYDELGNLTYGEYSYSGGILTDTCLTADDFDSYEYRDKAYDFVFEGNRYGTDYEILEILLERKKKQKQNKRY